MKEKATVAAAVKAGRYSVDRFVRRFTVRKISGFFWVRDNDESRLIAQCARLNDAVAISDAMNSVARNPITEGEPV